MKNSTKNTTDKAKNTTPTRISIIIPSAPDRDFSDILDNLRNVKPHNISLQILIVKGKWPPLQRNLAAEKADGKYVFLFDDDIIIPKGTLEKVIRDFEENPSVDVIGGPNLTPPKNTFLQRCFGLAHASYFTGAFASVRYHPAKKLKTTRAENLISCNLAFRSKVLKENPFDLGIFPNEENELLNRIQKKGHKLEYDPDFFIYHHRRKNLSSYVKQIFAWGKGRALHTIKRPQNFSIAFFVPLLFVIYLLTLIFLRNVFYLAPFFLYLLLDAGFSIQAAAREKNAAYFFAMLPILPLTHIIYAIGSFWGLLNFRSKPRAIPPIGELQIIETELL
jgi:succinoglycan biosynthesis protein ExoA